MMLNLLLYLTFILFSLGQFGRESFIGQQVNFYLYEIPYYLLLFIFLIKHKLDPFKKSIEDWKIHYFFFAWLAISFLVGVNRFNLQENAVSLLYFVRLVASFTYFFCLSFHVKKNPGFKKKLFQSLIIFSLITILISIVQYFFYPNLRNLSYLGWDPHQFRLFGSFFDESLAGAIFGLIFLFTLTSKSKFLKNKMLRIILLSTYLLFSTLSFSRGMYISLAISLTIYFTFNKDIKKLFLLLIISSLLVIAIPKPFGEGVNMLRSKSIESRLKDYSVAFSIWRKNPLFGIGYNRIRYIKKQLNVIDAYSSQSSHSSASFHSSFLIILVTSGVIGLILFFGVLFKLASIENASRFYLLFLGIFSLSDNIILHPFVLFLLFNLIIDSDQSSF